MTVNFLEGGAIRDTYYDINPAVQDNRWKITFPCTTDAIQCSSFMVADADYSIPAIDVISETKNGYVVPGFGADWYNRIHVTPINLDFGNLLSMQTSDITVWNAYFEHKTFTQVLESGDSGMQLIQPEATPVIYSPLEALVYKLKVGTNGPPAVSGSYIFDFSFVQITLTATGARVVIFPFMPQHGVEEALEWKTDVIRAKAKEQRIALRDAPRQSIGYRYFMNDRQVSLSRATHYGWAQRQFGVPVWFELDYIGPIAEGATMIDVDTTLADYRVGAPALIWQDDETFEALTVINVTPGTIYFDEGTKIPFTTAYVCPVRYGRAANGISYKRGPNKLVEAEVNFNILLNTDIGASAGLPTHAGLDVLTDVMYYLGSHDERIERNITYVDNGMAAPFADATYTTTDQYFTVSFAFTNRADLQRVRKWLHQRKGKWKPFWLPSRSADLEIVLDAASSAQALDVKTIGYPLYYTTRTIQIVRKNGVKTYHNVLGGVTVGQTDTLSLDAAIGTAASIANVDYISFMHKVRLDADRVEIRHEENNYVTIKFPVVEVSV